MTDNKPNSQYTIEDMAPYIEAIAVDLEAMADPNGKYNKHADELRGFAQVFRTRLETCCAAHKFEHIASIQMSIHATVLNCQCGSAFKHQFLSEVVDIIGKHMNECTKQAILQKNLAGRVN